MALSSLRVRSTGGHLFEGDYECNGRPRQIWRFDGKRIFAAYVSSNNINALRELYVTYRDGTSDRATSDYRARLGRIIDVGWDEQFQGERGFLVQLMQRDNGYDLRVHMVRIDGDEIRLEDDPQQKPAAKLSDTPAAIDPLDFLLEDKSSKGNGKK